VELEHVVEGVGVGKNLQPQVWFIADGEQPREIIDSDLLLLMNDVNKELALLSGKLHSLFRA
jgi:hypothetical protein